MICSQLRAKSLTQSRGLGECIALFSSPENAGRLITSEKPTCQDLHIQPSTRSAIHCQYPTSIQRVILKPTCLK